MGPEFFQTSEHLSNALNCAVAQSQIEGGVYLHDLAAGAVVRFRTQSHTYTLVNCGEGHAWLQGHPDYCPKPVLVRINGSSWGGTALKRRFIGRGMHLEFEHPEYRRPIVTSLVREIREGL